MRRTIRPAAWRSTGAGAGKDRSLAAFADRQVDGPGRPGGEGDGHHLAPFADDGDGAVAALEPEVLDLGADGFGDPQPVERQQADERVIPGIAESAATSMAPTSLRSCPVAWDS
jgi:hypothetical protein